MTQAAYNRLSDEEKLKHDEYMRKYYAGEYYRKQTERYMPQCNKMDKFHLAYAITNGANLFGLDHFAWKKLKELGPEPLQLKHIVEFGKPYSPEIYEEATTMLQELGSNFTS